MDELPVLQTQRLTLFVAGPEDAARCVRFNRDNAVFLAPWEPPMNERSFDERANREARTRAVADAFAGTSYGFAIVPAGSGRDAALLGFCSITNLVRGVFQAAYLGYKLDERAQGNGYMTEAAEAAIAFAFDTLRLHRIMANYMPHNQRSAALLRRLGFTIEGSAKQYLYIAGEWRDHVLTSKTNPAPLVPPGF